MRQQLQQPQIYHHYSNTNNQYLPHRTKQTSPIQLHSYPQQYGNSNPQSYHNSQLDTSSSSKKGQQYTTTLNTDSQLPQQGVQNKNNFTHPQQQLQQPYHYTNSQQQQQMQMQTQNNQNTQQEAQEETHYDQYRDDQSTAVASPPLNGQPKLSRDFVVRRTSEGETGRVKEELRCEACGKGYKHISSLAKHLWEHTPEWNVTKKLLISKHQQVQLLEAASILVGMNHDSNGNANANANGSLKYKKVRHSTSFHGGPPASLQLLHKRGVSEQLPNLPSPFSPTSDHENSNNNNIDSRNTSSGTIITPTKANGSDSEKLLQQQPPLPSESAIHSDSDNHSEVEVDSSRYTKNNNSENNGNFNHQYSKSETFTTATTTTTTKGSNEYQFKPQHSYGTIPQFPLRNDIKQPTPISPSVSNPKPSSLASQPSPPQTQTQLQLQLQLQLQPTSTLNGGPRNHFFVINQ